MGKFMHTEPSDGNPKITEWILIAADEIGEKEFQEQETQAKKRIAQTKQSTLATKKSLRQGVALQPGMVEVPSQEWFEDDEMTLAMELSLNQADLELQSLGLYNSTPQGTQAQQSSEVSQGPKSKVAPVQRPRVPRRPIRQSHSPASERVRHVKSPPTASVTSQRIEYTAEGRNFRHNIQWTINSSLAMPVQIDDLKNLATLMDNGVLTIEQSRGLSEKNLCRSQKLSIGHRS